FPFAAPLSVLLQPATRKKVETIDAKAHKESFIAEYSMEERKEKRDCRPASARVGAALREIVTRELVDRLTARLLHLRALVPGELRLEPRREIPRESRVARLVLRDDRHRARD